MTLRVEYQLRLKIATLRVEELDKIVPSMVTSLRSLASVGGSSASSATSAASGSSSSAAERPIPLKPSADFVRPITLAVLPSETLLTDLSPLDDKPAKSESPNPLNYILFKKAGYTS